MSYLRFERSLMTNLEESLSRELLRTNRSGAYSCSTIVDCNTRKYHGLLVVPVPELDEENHVLLSSLDVTVVQHGAEFNLGLHKYRGNNFSPNGHKYIREFNCDSVPTTIIVSGESFWRKKSCSSIMRTGFFWDILCLTPIVPQRFASARLWHSEASGSLLMRIQRQIGITSL